MPKKIDAVAAERGLSRRKFGQEAALAGVAAVLGVGSAGAAAKSAPAAEHDLAGKDEVEARFQRVIQQYGEHLSDEEKTRIRKILAYNERLLQPIRSFPLENGQSPATGLKLYPDPARLAGEGHHTPAEFKKSDRKS